MELEQLSNDWDTYYRQYKLSLAPFLNVFPTQSKVNDMQELLNLHHISKIALFNIQSYALFHMVSDSYEKWLAYEQKLKVNDRLQCCLVINVTTPEEVKLTIHVIE